MPFAGAQARKGIYRHHVALPIQGVIDRLDNGFFRPQIPRAAVRGPALSIGVVETSPIQSLACIGLARTQDELWLTLRRYDQMHMPGTNMQRMECPSPKPAFFDHGVAYDLATGFIQQIDLLRH